MATGSAFVIVGFGFLAWGLVMSDGDPWPGLSVSFIVVGAIVALVGYAMARWGGSSRRDSSSA